MASKTFRELRIFVGCPGDVSKERDIVHEVAKELEVTAEGNSFKLKVLDWRAVVPNAGRGQGVIFNDLKPKSWDVFIGVLWHRFGTPPGGHNPNTGADYDSGTHEEFLIAYELGRQNNGRPRMMMYQCSRPYPTNVETEQLDKVREFLKNIRDPKGKTPVLTQSFESSEEFKKRISSDLQSIILEFKDHEEEENTESEVKQTEPPKETHNNLPTQGEFFGREKDLKKIREALTYKGKSWGILITALGGMGKTSLALAAAHRAMDEGLFKNCVFISAKQNRLEPEGNVDVEADALAVDEFLNETARQLGQQGIGQLEHKEKRKALLEHLKTTLTLLVYDNLETLREQQKDIARFLLELPTGCKAILTSRKEGGEGGRHLSLEAIEWEDAQKIIEAEKEKDSGLEKRLGIEIEKWQDLYKETFGSPLALLHILGLMRIRRTLSINRAIEQLKEKDGLTARMDYLFAEAWNELNEEDLATLYALSFFEPSASMEALSAVAQLNKDDLEEAVNHIGKLCLLDNTTESDRFALHPLTREFVVKELAKFPDLIYKSGMRFTDFWLEFTNKNGWLEYDVFSNIDREWSNIVAATNWLWKTADLNEKLIDNYKCVEFLNYFADNLQQYLINYGRWDFQILFCNRCYELLIPTKDKINLGWRSYEIATRYLDRGEIVEGEYWTKKADIAWQTSGEKICIAEGKRLMGIILGKKNDYESAEKYILEALEIYTNRGHNDGIANALDALATIALYQDDYDKAEVYYKNALEKCDTDRCITLGNLGLVEIKRKNYNASKEYYKNGLEAAIFVNSRVTIARCLSGLAEVEEAIGKLSTGIELAEQAILIYEDLKSRDLPETQKLLTRIKAKLGEQSAK